MSLKVWLPLNGDLENKGLENLTITNNNATTNANGKIGSCYYFNGTDARISCSSVTYPLPLSICAWIKGETITASGTEYILSYNTATGGTAGHNIGIGTYGGKLSIWHGGSVSSYSVALTNNIWYHVAAVVTQTGYRLYLDGSEILSAIGTQSDVNSSWLTFGARSNSSTGGAGGASYYFKGYMNDIRVYNHALSAAEIKEISQGLVLHYKLDGIGPSFGNPNLLIDGMTPTAAGNGATGITREIEDGIQKIVAASPNSNWCTFGNHNTTLALTKGDTFTFSLMIRSPDSNKKPTVYFQSGLGYYSMQGTMSNNWSIIYYTGTWSIDNLQTNIHLGFSSAPGTYYIKYFKLEKGSSVTSWAPKEGEALSDLKYIQDSSGYNHNGTLLNDISISSDTSRYSTSINLIAGNSAINCGRGGMVTDSITVNLWLKSSAWANPISCTEGGGWNFEASGDYFRFPIYISGVGYKYGQSTHTKAQICNNEWHMLTGIYDRLNQKVKIYVDGELDNEYDAGTSNAIGYNSTNVIWLGAEASSSATAIASNGMIGLFSDLRIYATPLLDNDIKSLYNVGMKIDNQQQIHTFEGFEQLSNIMYKPNLAIGAQEWKDGLNRYQQPNCQVSLTENGVRIQRPANLSQANNGNTMYGGIKIVNSATDSVHAYDASIDNIFNLQKNHTYIWIFYVKGNTTNAPSFQVNNNMGWGGGGLTPSPSNVEIKNIPTNFDGETEVWYKFTISDDIVKTCTSSYSSFVANTQYLSYKHFGWNWSYATTGNGTDIYVTNIRLYDITDIPIGKLTKTGITKFSSIFEVNDSIHITKNEDLIVNQFIER